MYLHVNKKKKIAQISLNLSVGQQYHKFFPLQQQVIDTMNSELSTTLTGKELCISLLMSKFSLIIIFYQYLDTLPFF